MEAVAQEVAPFGIQMTLIEPGPTATGFGGALDQADALPAYADTPSGAIRSALFGENAGAFSIDGDVEKMVAAIIACADAAVAPRRLLLEAVRTRACMRRCANGWQSWRRTGRSPAPWTWTGKHELHRRMTQHAAWPIPAGHRHGCQSARQC